MLYIHLAQPIFDRLFDSCFILLGTQYSDSAVHYDTIMLTTSHIMSQVCFISNTNDKHIQQMLGVDTLQGVCEKISDFFV